MELGSRFDPLITQVDKSDLLNDMIPYRCPKCGSLRRFTALRDLKLHLEKEHAFKMECVKPRSRTKVFNHGDTKTGIKIGKYQRTKEGGKFTPRFDDSNTTKSKYISKLSQRLDNSDFWRHNDGNLSSRSDNSDQSGLSTSKLLKTYDDEARVLEMRVKMAKEKEMSNKLNRNILSKSKGDKSVRPEKTFTPEIDDSRPDNHFLYQERQINNREDRFATRGDNFETPSLPRDSSNHNKRNFQETLHSINNELLVSRHNQWKKEEALYQAHDVLLGVEQAAENRCLDQQEVIQDLVNDLRQKEGQLTKANQDLERLRQERQALLRETEDLFVQADSGSKALKEELNRHEDMLDSVNEQLQTLRLEATTALEQKEDELTLARERVCGLDTERQRLVSETQNLLKQADRERVILKRHLDLKENQLRRVNRDMDRLKTEQEDLVQESMSLYEKANDGTSKLKHLVETKDSQLQQACRELEEMRNVHEKLIQQSHKLTNQANTNSQKLTDLLKAKEAELETAKQELEEVKSERSKIQVTAKDLAEIASHKDIEVERLQRLVESKGEQLAVKEKELESLKSFLNTTADKEVVARDKLEIFINNLIERADKAESELSRLQSQSSSRSHTDVSRSQLNNSRSNTNSLRSRSQSPVSISVTDSLEKTTQRSKSLSSRQTNDDTFKFKQTSVTKGINNAQPITSDKQKEDNAINRKRKETGNKKPKYMHQEPWKRILHEHYISDSVTLSDSEYQHGEGSQKIDTRLRTPEQKSHELNGSEARVLNNHFSVKGQNTEVVEVQVHSVPNNVSDPHHKSSDLSYTPDQIPVRDNSVRPRIVKRKFHGANSSSPYLHGTQNKPDGNTRNNKDLDHQHMAQQSRETSNYQGQGQRHLNVQGQQGDFLNAEQGQFMHGIPSSQGHGITYSQFKEQFNPQGHIDMMQQGYEESSEVKDQYTIPKSRVYSNSITRRSRSKFPKRVVLNAQQMESQSPNRLAQHRYVSPNKARNVPPQTRGFVTNRAPQHTEQLQSAPYKRETIPPQHPSSQGRLTTKQSVARTVLNSPSVGQSNVRMDQNNVQRAPFMTEQNWQSIHENMPRSQGQEYENLSHQTGRPLQGQNQVMVEPFPRDNDLSLSQRHPIRPHSQGHHRTNIRHGLGQIKNLQHNQGEQTQDGIVYVPFDLTTGQPHHPSPAPQTNTSQGRPIVIKPPVRSPTRIPQNLPKGSWQYGQQSKRPPTAAGNRQIRMSQAEHGSIVYNKIPTPPAGQLRSRSDSRSMSDHPSLESSSFHDNSLADVVSLNEYDDYSNEPDDIESEDFEYFMDENGIMWEASAQSKLDSQRISPAGSEISPRQQMSRYNEPGFMVNQSQNLALRSRSLSPRIRTDSERHVKFNDDHQMSSASDGCVQYSNMIGRGDLDRGYHSNFDLSQSRNMASPSIMKKPSTESTLSPHRQRKNDVRTDSNYSLTDSNRKTKLINKGCQSLKDSGTQTWLLDQPLGTANLDEIRQRSSFVRTVTSDSTSSTHTSPRGTNSLTHGSPQLPNVTSTELKDRGSHASSGSSTIDLDLGMPTDFLYKRRPVKGLTYTSSISGADDNNSASVFSLESKKGESARIQAEENMFVNSSSPQSVKHQQNFRYDSPNVYSGSDSTFQNSQNTAISSGTDKQNSENQSNSRNSSERSNHSGYQNGTINRNPRAGNSRSSQEGSRSPKSFYYSHDFASLSGSKDLSDSPNRNHSQSPTQSNSYNGDLSKSPTSIRIPKKSKEFPDSPLHSKELSVSPSNHSSEHLNIPFQLQDNSRSETMSSRSLTNQTGDYYSKTDQSDKSCSEISISKEIDSLGSEEDLQSDAIVSDAISSAFKFLNDENSSIHCKNDPIPDDKRKSPETGHGQFPSRAVSDFSKPRNNTCSPVIGTVDQQAYSEPKEISNEPDKVALQTFEMGYSPNSHSPNTYHSEEEDAAEPVASSGRKKKKKRKGKQGRLPEQPPQEVLSDAAMDTDENIELGSVQSFGRTLSITSSEESLLDRLPQSRREEIRGRRNTLFQIFRYLDTKSLARCAEVSREWKKVSRQSALWKRVCICDAAISSQDLVQLSMWCTKMEHLSLLDIKPWQQGGAEDEEEKLQSARASLEPGFERLLQVSESTLKSLTIINCGNLLTDKSIWLSSCYSRMIQRVTYLSHTDPLGPDVMWALGAGCGCITTLIIPPLYPCCSPEKFNNKCLQIISQCLPDLEVLEVGGQQIDINGLVLIAKSCQRLHSLALHRVSEITDDLAVALSRMGLKGLRCLSFVNTPVTAQAILQFFNFCKHLRDIKVTLSIEDVYENPKQKGRLQEYTDRLTRLEKLKQKAGLGNILTLELTLPDNGFEEEEQEEEEENSELHDTDDKSPDKEEEIGTIDRIRNFFK